MQGRLSLICMTLQFAASVVQTVFRFPLLCYTCNKQGLTTADFELWNRKMSCIWLLIGCGCLTKLAGSWREEITVTVGVDRDGGGSSV
jgi:hypothetical protein